MTATLWTLGLVIVANPALAQTPPSVTVHDAAQLRAAVSASQPGSRILIAAGVYEGGFHFTGLRGSEKLPVLIAGESSTNPPVFRGGSCGFQLTDPEHVELRDVIFEQHSGNGLNIDDGGSWETPAKHIVLRNLVLRDIGPKGNCDGIKLSGVDSFLVQDCSVERWGSGGSAIDMVGCHRGVVERCVFRNPADSANATSANGVQTKGGSSEITIQRNRFEHAGSRGVNIGGSTGLEYFRPPLEKGAPPFFEAKDVVVQGNTFIGCEAPIAFVGVDGAHVRFNTIYAPGRYVLRILQETREPNFVPSRGGQFSDNLVVYAALDQGFRGVVNIGPGTEPSSFRFERNVWTSIDESSRSRLPRGLPVDEKDGVYGVDPMFVDAPAGNFGLRSGSPAARVGAGAFSD